MKRRDDITVYLYDEGLVPGHNYRYSVIDEASYNNDEYWTEDERDKMIPASEVLEEDSGLSLMAKFVMPGGLVKWYSKVGNGRWKFYTNKEG